VPHDHENLPLLTFLTVEVTRHGNPQRLSRNCTSLVSPRLDIHETPRRVGLTEGLERVVLSPDRAGAPFTRLVDRASDRTLQRLAETTMSNPHLPAETLDHIVDDLHDAQDALRSCCLVSKSWIPRTRKHLFADVRLPTAKSIQSWKDTFPDPSTSPAHYAKAGTVADADAGWIRGFSHVAHLEVGTRAKHRLPGPDESVISLVPLRGFSPFIKSLRVLYPVHPPSQVFDLILSFPLLDDLAVTVYYETPTDNDDNSRGDKIPTTARPSSPPMFTWSLELSSTGRMEPFIGRLLSLPGGIHFRKLTLTWSYEESLSSATVLVEKCSHTLESLDIACGPLCAFIQHLRLRQRLTFVPRASSDQPLESDKTQRCGFSAKNA
jgi:hypothetical protein